MKPLLIFSELTVNYFAVSAGADIALTESCIAACSIIAPVACSAAAIESCIAFSVAAFSSALGPQATSAINPAVNSVNSTFFIGLGLFIFYLVGAKVVTFLDLTIYKSKN